jgi:hypothetical protein
LFVIAQEQKGPNVHTYVHIYIHISIHTHVHDIHTYTYTYIYPSIHPSIHLTYTYLPTWGHCRCEGTPSIPNVNVARNAAGVCTFLPPARHQHHHRSSVIGSRVSQSVIISRINHSAYYAGMYVSIACIHTYIHTSVLSSRCSRYISILCP